jgi:Ni/Fe-hydrogenase subunit HybB-like protein
MRGAAMNTQAGPRSSAGRAQERRPGQSPYAAQPITKTPNWGVLTALDLLLNNLAVGTFLAAVVAVLLRPAWFAPVFPWTLILSLLLLGADLLLLVLDLGDPRRFHHMLRVFKPAAPMSLGTWSLSLFGVLLGLAALAAFVRLWGGPAWLDWVARGLAVVALLPALGSILYKGVLFSVTSQPGWQEARWLGAYVCNSAVLLGSAVLLFLAAAAGAGEAAASLRLALLGLLLLDVVLFLLLYRDIAATFRARYGDNGRTFFWLGVVASGWLVPLLLLVQGEIVALLPVVFLVLGGLVARLGIVLLPPRTIA